MLLCPLLAVAIHGESPMKKVPEGYLTGVCHYDGRTARGYTLATDADVKPEIVSRYGEAMDITVGDETVITWSEMDRPRDLAKDGIRMIVLVKQGKTSRIHVSAVDRIPGEQP